MANQRIPDDQADEIFQRAAELYAQQKGSQGYSTEDLMQAGAEAQIPPEFVQAAIAQVQQQHLQAQQQQQQQQQQARERRRQVSIGAIALGVVLAGWLMWAYNSLASAEQTVDLAWAQVENQFQRRADLIPNLVNVTQAGAQQERELVAQLTQSRQNYLAASTQTEQVEAAEQVTAALNQFQTYAIGNPQLQSNQLFVGLQDELAGTENRIAVERMRYNQAVAAYNRRVKAFPNTLVAPLLGFEAKPLFQATTSEPPAIAPSLSP